jgi:Flp pilus assembly protein TadG
MTEAESSWGERGSLTAFFVLLVVAFLLVAGLVYDGGALLTARRDVADVAQDAARAGAQAIDVAAVRGGSPTLAPDAAVTAAHRWLAVEGHTGTVTVAGDTVAVTVTDTVPLTLLSLAGLSARTVSAVEQARIVSGVTEATP